LSTVAWFKLHGIVKLQVSSSHDTSWYRRSAISWHRRYWYHHVWHHDTYGGIAGIAQHYGWKTVYK